MAPKRKSADDDPVYAPLPTKAAKRAKSASPSTTTEKTARKRKTKSSTSNDTKLQFKSPAEFFAENKNIAGFDNPGKSLYTTIRELVENGLDAAEEIGILPEIAVVVEELSVAQYQELTKTNQQTISDPTLYKANQPAKKQGGTRKNIPQHGTANGNANEDGNNHANANANANEDGNNHANVNVNVNANEDGNNHANANANANEDGNNHANVNANEDGNNLVNANVSPLSQSSNMFRITVTDNGCGMKHDSIPNMMGRVLAGTKYCVKQNRGKFGLGSKMALIWAKMSTGMPVQIQSKQRKVRKWSELVLDIDISTNRPHILKDEQSGGKSPFVNGHGTRVSLVIEGYWKTYRAKIVKYLRQMAVITPYADFRLQFISAEAASSNANNDNRSFSLFFKRRADRMPSPPLEVKHHPSSVNQLLIKQLISQLDTKATTMTVPEFLSSEFSNISHNLATRLANELGEDLSSRLVSELTIDDIRRIDSLFKAAHFNPPDGSCLSPAGEYNLRLGVLKELKPEMVATYAEPANVFEGHPFIVEAAVSLGGIGLPPGITVFRFANRIPLLFEQSNDVVTRTANKSILWSAYKISSQNDKIGVFVSIVSTKIPFKGTGKEYIGDDATEIKKAVKHAIAQCCLQLKSKIVRKGELKLRAERKKNLVRYVPDVARAVSLLWNAASINAQSRVHAIRNAEAKAFAGQPPDEKVVRDRLREYVERQDQEQALEHIAATGRDDQTVKLVLPAPRASPEFYGGLVSAVVGTRSVGANGPAQTESLLDLKVEFCFLKRLQALM